MEILWKGDDFHRKCITVVLQVLFLKRITMNRRHTVLMTCLYEIFNSFLRDKPRGLNKATPKLASRSVYRPISSPEHFETEIYFELENEHFVVRR